MSYLHEKKIVHLNLKPENILLNEKYEPIIKIDITSKRPKEKLDLSSILTEFSYPYVAPELFYNEIDDFDDLKKCDVYSFAMICYFLFVEKTPFKKIHDNHLILMKAMNGERPLTKGIISYPFVNLIEECWNKDSNLRPSFKNILNTIGSPIFIKSIHDIDYDEFYQYQKHVDKEYIQMPPFPIRKKDEFEIQKVISRSLPTNVKLVKDKLKGQNIAYTEITDSNCKFIERAQLFARINFPSIIKPQGLIKPDKKNENIIILLPYALNGNLESLIEQKHLNYTQKCIILYGIAVGMLKFHEQGIAHKNLHPRNILINKDFEPWISGFIMSLSHMYDDICYIPPEILLDNERNEIDECASDVYSFGMVAYYLLTGNKPWKDIGDIFAIYQKIVDGERPNFPEDIEQPIINLISKCWETLPKNRLTFNEICEIISDYNFYFNQNYLFDTKKFYYYQLKLGELRFIKFSKNEIEQLENKSMNTRIRQAVCLRGDDIHQLQKYFELSKHFKKSLIDRDPRNKSYLIPSNISEDLFNYNLFKTQEFNKIMESFDKISIEINYPSESLIHNIRQILVITYKDEIKKKRIRIVLVISKILHFICLPKIEYPPLYVVIQTPAISIGNEAFKDCKSLVKIVIPSSVTNIGKSAFECCSSLTKISLTSSILKIGENAFNKCTSLSSISLPSTLKDSFDAKYIGISEKTKITYY